MSTVSPVQRNVDIKVAKTEVIASRTIDNATSDGLFTVMNNYNNQVEGSKDPSQDFDQWVEANTPSFSNNYVTYVSSFINSSLQNQNINIGTLDFDHYLEIETNGKKDNYAFLSSTGQVVIFNVKDETTEVLSQSDFIKLLDKLDGKGSNSIIDLDGSIQSKLVGKTIKFERDKIVLEDVNSNNVATGLTFNDASKPFAGSISYTDAEALYNKSKGTNTSIAKNSTEYSTLKNEVKYSIGASLGLTKPDPSDDEATNQYNIKILEALTGKKFATDGEDYMQPFRNEVLDGFLDIVASDIVDEHNSGGVHDNPDGQLTIRTGNINGITFDEQKLMLKHPELKDASGAHIDSWDKMTTEKAHKQEFIDYANKLFDPKDKSIKADDITVDNGEIKVKMYKTGDDIVDNTSRTGIASGQVIVEAQISADRVREIKKNNSKPTDQEVSIINSHSNLVNNSFQQSLKDGIDLDTTTYHGYKKTVTGLGDPIGFTAEDGTRFDFVEDENNDGIFNGAEEFVGYDKDWADLLKYDTDGNGVIEGSELDKLNVLVSNTNGSSHITSARAAGIGPINLGSRKEVNETNKDGNITASTFELEYNGKKVTGEQTYDTKEFLEKEHKDDYGMSFFG